MLTWRRLYTTEIHLADLQHFVGVKVKESQTFCAGSDKLKVTRLVNLLKV